MNSAATEIFQSSSPLQRTRTHRCLYINSAIDNDKIIVPELIYESKYTPNTVTALLQHAEARKEYISDKSIGQNKRPFQSRQASILRKSDYITPISAPFTSPHQRLLLPNIGKSTTKPLSSASTHISKVENPIVHENPMSSTFTSTPHSPETNHIVKLTFTLDGTHNPQAHSPSKVTPGSPTVKTVRQFLDASSYSSINFQSNDRPEYRADQKPLPSTGQLHTPAPSRVQSRLQTTNSTLSVTLDNNIPLKYKSSTKTLNADPGFSIRSVVNDLLALPTPQIHCTSPSLRMRFLSSDQ
ncbi:Hypothetical protein GLP15_5243 [Giardia lamblia P15]|uniref:Uncharacterized protein n=1 Tax=Giardia intestinalis (strain P15) TaxID=658858 RepID=E1F6A0_GIAIA|nr:Hypothetical protein GLP15_5243 [Giardia lamblia P15]